MIEYYTLLQNTDKMNFSEEMSTLRRHKTLDVTSSSPAVTWLIICYTCAESLPIYTIGVIFCNKFIVPALLIFGVIGNILTLVVLRGRLFRSSPSSVALSALALADIGVLSSGGLHQWLHNGLGFDIRKLSLLSCKIHRFASSITLQLSTSFLVLTTLERVIGIWFPLKIKVWVTRKRMLYVCLALTLAVFVVYFPVLIDARLADNINGGCTWGHNTNARVVIWWIEMMLTGFIQVPIILIGNLLIIFQLIRTAKKRSEEMITTGNKLDNSVIVMLVSIGVIFLLTIVPQKLFYLGLQYNIWYDFTEIISYRYVAVLQFVINTIQILPFVNSAINFVAYCLCGSRFRAAFKSLFRKPQ